MATSTNMSMRTVCISHDTRGLMGSWPIKEVTSQVFPTLWGLMMPSVSLVQAAEVFPTLAWVNGVRQYIGCWVFLTLHELMCAHLKLDWSISRVRAGLLIFLQSLLINVFLSYTGPRLSWPGPIQSQFTASWQDPQKGNISILFRFTALGFSFPVFR